MVNLSAIILRYKKIENKREFKMPLNIGKFPLLSFLGVLSSVIMIFYLEVKAVVIGSLILLFGILILLMFRKTKK
ncbi:MAG: hypothetical protein COY38_04635 [Candidatus Aenigmarchaeota archaeon CG_4_10_14_0_8_um_filter_37_24]|nr:MAG: hypothetical protein AUJ50_01985 [Candidatus Aenigmarchaeota archaeon CG1_02_38_14]PIV69556.1 MAG: hypothetical protein COS07_00340 [Candidatus Aenigmarchaeota archaeon CG01_land_8_20_14_3_00_37_9]PIW41632.1 MAG: hypothetical protein COW21_00900 [Candidatus Aenigmarchaeota archaeon CG15_BIG_FIL_POST_REV_8_21_14_020_37_27]PIZ34122.1 MAG: hypothetical protein COY38_04635 [Candidatus Aenigmarchaeota archaeon CG_4_10_14_0_8_um_filter_37_24]